MNVYQYTALANRRGSSELVHSYGLRPANDPSSLAKQLASLVVRYKEDALNGIKKIHPDLMLFQKDIESYKEQLKKDHEDKFSNVDGQTIKSEIASLKDAVSNKAVATTTDSTKHNKTELLIIGGIIVIGLAIIFKK